MSTERQKNKKVITAADKREMREMRAQGIGMKKLATLFDVSLSVIHRHVHDVVTPRKQAAVKPVSAGAVTKFERAQRAKDRTNSFLKPPGTRPRNEGRDQWDPHSYPFAIPDDDYDTTGPLPDPALALHAQAILTQWTEALNKGRIYPTRPTVVTQASLIQLAGLPIWDYDTFLEDRTMWKVVRKLAGVSSHDLAADTGISISSISRYEKGDRTPASGHLRLLHNAYTELAEKAHRNAETLLVIDSYCQDRSRITGVATEDVTFNRDQLLEWTASDSELEDFTIDHIESLVAVRSWLPNPQWRTSAVHNLFLIGYPNAPALQTA